MFTDLLFNDNVCATVALVASVLFFKILDDYTKQEDRQSERHLISNSAAAMFVFLILFAITDHFTIYIIKSQALADLALAAWLALSRGWNIFGALTLFGFLWTGLWRCIEVVEAQLIK